MKMNEISLKMRMNIKKAIIMLSMAFSASSLTMYAGPADGPIDDEAVKTYAEMVNMSEIGRPSPAPVKAKFDVLNAGSKIASPRIVLDENSSSWMASPVSFSGVSMPSSFRGVKANVIEGASFLKPLFAKIARGGKTVRILQIGDSHVRGNIFPQTIRKVLDTNLNKDRQRVSFDYIGINGARASKFTNESLLQQITAKHPDLVIVSFGGNEAHGNFSYSNNVHVYENLVASIRRYNPDVQFLLTTPPGSFISRGGAKVVNRTYDEVCRSIKDFGLNHGIAVWDHYHNIGGSEYAANNWNNARMMQADRIHLTAAGYRLMGSLLAESIISAYNNGGRM